MSVQTKKRFKNLGKIIGVVLFVTLMFTNIKIALMDDTELGNGDISVLGIKLNLFEATYASEAGDFCNAIGCQEYGIYFCGVGTGPKGTFVCWSTYYTG